LRNRCLPPGKSRCANRPRVFAPAGGRRSVAWLGGLRSEAEQPRSRQTWLLRFASQRHPAVSGHPGADSTAETARCGAEMTDESGEIAKENGDGRRRSIRIARNGGSRHGETQLRRPLATSDGSGASRIGLPELQGGLESWKLLTAVVSRKPYGKSRLRGLRYAAIPILAIKAQFRTLHAL
jgi:hypothetical protein